MKLLTILLLFCLVVHASISDTTWWVYSYANINFTTLVSNGTVTNIATTPPLTGGPITTTGTLGITQSSTSVNGYLSSTDWTNFNNKAGTGSCSGANVVQTTTTGGVTCLNVNSQFSATLPITYSNGIIGENVLNSSQAGYVNTVIPPLSVTKDGNLSIVGTCPVNQWVTGTNATAFACQALSTTNVTEGTNLYYTDARAQATRAAAFTSNANTCTDSTMTTAKMMGFGTTYTTKASHTTGTVIVTLNFEVSTPTVLGATNNWRVAYGTGSAPACNAGATGTLVGNSYDEDTIVAIGDSRERSVSFEISGLTANTAYWFDLQSSDNSISSWVFSKPQMTVIEI